MWTDEPPNSVTTPVALLDRLRRQSVALLDGRGARDLEQAFAGDPDLIDHLDELVDASLVNGPDHAGCYRMPIPVSEYFAAGRDGVDRDRERILSAVLSIVEPVVSKVDQRTLGGGQPAR